MNKAMSVSTAARLALAIGAAASTATACGSSSSPTMTSAESSGGLSPSRAASSPAAPVSAPAKPLPAPCTLVTIADVAPFFGTSELSAGPKDGIQHGVAECVFTLKVGTQGKAVYVTTHDNYIEDQSYVIPSQGARPVKGLGYPAVIQTTRSTPCVPGKCTASSQLTINLGKNALSVGVDFYTDAADEAFVIKVAKAALAHTA